MRLITALSLLATLAAAARDPTYGTLTPQPSPPDYAFCGGFIGARCDEGLICIDDPRDDCDPRKGGADCGGLCVFKGMETCGGFTGRLCPEEGQICVDDPFDDCDPVESADCLGICV